MKGIKRALVAMLSLCAAGYTMASEDHHDDLDQDSLHSASHQLQELIVSGGTGRVTYKNTPQPISIIKHTAIEQRLAPNIISALASEPGVSEVTTGSGISKPVIRGLGFNRLVVVANGQRQEGQQWGDEHGIEVDGSSVGSVEILKGPASMLYGSDAMAGVIIFRPRPIPLDGEAEAEAALEYHTNDGLMSTALGGGGRSGGFFWDVRAAAKMSHDMRTPSQSADYDYIRGTAFRQWATSATLGTTGHWGVSRLSATHFAMQPGMVEAEELDGSKQYAIKLPFQRIHHTSVTSDNSINCGRGNIQVLLGMQSNSRQEYEESEDECGLCLDLGTFNYSVGYTSATLKHDITFRTGVSGMNQSSENKGEEYLVPDYRISDVGLFATMQKDSRKVSLSAGARFDHRKIVGYGLEEDDDQLFEDFTRRYSAVSGSAGAVFHLDSINNLKLNLSHGFRSPNISELSSNGVHEGTQHFEKGNVDLKAEQSLQADLGYELNNHIVHIAASLFFNNVSNYIFLSGTGAMSDEGNAIYTFTQSDARLWGGEAVVDIHPIRHLHYQNTFSIVKTRLNGHGSLDKYLPQTPAPRLVSEIRYDIVHLHHNLSRIIKNLWASVNVDCNWRQDECYLIGFTETPTDEYALIGAAIGADICRDHRPFCSIYFTADNLANKRYFNHLSRLKNIGEGIPGQGRNFAIKAVFRVGREAKESEL